MSRKCVVVIEDNPDIAIIHERYLRSDYDVVVVTENFPQVLIEDFWDGVDAAIVDLLLGPPITGVDVLEFLKENAPQVRRIVCTALSKIVQNVSDELAHARVIKPMNFDKVIAAIEGTEEL